MAFSKISTLNIFANQKSNRLNFASQANPNTSKVSGIGGSISSISDSGNNYTLHTFTSTSSFTLYSGGQVDMVLVGGGGGGGHYYGPGGGGGGRVETFSQIMSPGTYSVVIGPGGADSTAGNTTSVTGSTLNLSCVGGQPGQSGVSVGGGTSGNGFSGGSGFNGGGGRSAGGGGGGSSANGNNAGNGHGGSGGAGLFLWNTNISQGLRYAGGGGGGGDRDVGNAAGVDGGGNGAPSGSGSQTGSSGSANRGGGGGGGGGLLGGAGGSGGSGIVVIRYLT